ncbi:hypothetical protein, partial [Magnetospirillum moscoviense]|uniref:hypothetical protein n=1 Tax=Magnetospirillum moscoviense TaxID=1437059 RepID=UPI001FDF3A24
RYRASPTVRQPDQSCLHLRFSPDAYVPGGLPVTSYVTRLIPVTSFLMGDSVQTVAENLEFQPSL